MSMYISIIGVVASAAIAWGIMKATVHFLQKELDTLKTLLPDFAALKVQVGGVTEELMRLRDQFEETHGMLTGLQTEVRVEAAKSRRRRANGSR